MTAHEEYTVQEFGAGDAPAQELRRDAYDEDRLDEHLDDMDLRDGVTFTADDGNGDIAVFADVYEDDQVLHTGDEEALQEYDDEYGASAVLDMDEIDTRVVPGAQLLNLTMDALDDVERIDSVSFDQPVLEGQTARLVHDGTEDGLDSYVIEAAADDGYVATGTVTVEHGEEDRSDTYGSLLPIGMGLWDRTGDVLLGYDDVAADDGFDPDDDLTFTREALGGKDTPAGRIQQYQNTFTDEDGDELAYTVGNLHL